MRVAVIGTGFIANTHASSLLNEKQTLALVVGTSVEKAREFARVWNFERYSDCFEDALSADIDCIHITTPPPLHYDMAMAAMKAGKSVICEKPLCLDPAQAKALYEESKKSGKICAVNYNVRFHDASKRARDILQAKELGEELYLTGSYFQSFGVMPTAYSWRFKPEIGGKMRCITEIGSHWIDLIRYLTGLEITEVAADFGYVLPERHLKDGMLYEEPSEGSVPMTCESEDNATIMLRFSNGAKGVLSLSQFAHGRSNKIGYEIHGSHGSIWWDSEDPLKLHTAKHGQGIRTEVNGFAGAFPDTHAKFFHQVYEAIQQGNTLDGEVPGFYDGYVVSAVCDAIYESAVNGSRWTKIVL